MPPDVVNYPVENLSLIGDAVFCGESVLPDSVDFGVVFGAQGNCCVITTPGAFGFNVVGCYLSFASVIPDSAGKRTDV